MYHFKFYTLLILFSCSFLDMFFFFFFADSFSYLFANDVQLLLVLETSASCWYWTLDQSIGCLSSCHLYYEWMLVETYFNKLYTYILNLSFFSFLIISVFTSHMAINNLFVVVSNIISYVQKLKKILYKYRIVSSNCISVSQSFTFLRNQIYTFLCYKNMW